MNRISLSLLVVAASCGATVQAEDRKVVTSTEVKTATPELHLVFDQYDATQAGSSKEKQDAIAALQNKYATELEGKRQTSAKRVEEFNAKKDIMTKEVRDKEQADLIALSRDLQNEVQKAQELVRAEVNKLTDELMREIETAAVEIAKNMNADTLTEKNTGRIVYQKDPTKDITAKVKEKMNKDYEVKVAKNKTEAKDGVRVTQDAKVQQKTVTSKA